MAGAIGHRRACSPNAADDVLFQPKFVAEAKFSNSSYSDRYAD